MLPEAVRSWWQQRTRWEQAALLLWTAVVLGLCIPSLLNPGAHTVYPVYESSGRNWLEGKPLYPIGAKPTDYLFRYSPIVAAWFAPWSLLPDRLGNGLWRLLNAGVFVPALFWYCRRVLPQALSRDRRAQLFLLALPLVGVSIHNGQCNVLVIGLILTCCAAVAAQRWNLAALALALACLFKVYPIALGLLLVLFHARQFSARFLIGLGLGLVLPFMLQHPVYVFEQYQFWFYHMSHNDRHVTEMINWFRDFRMLLYYVGVNLSYDGYLMVELVAGAAIALVCVAAWWRRVRGPELLNLITALACCWMTVFGPSTETCTFCLIAPALAWFLVDRERHGRWLLAGGWCAYGLVGLPIVAGWLDLQRNYYLLPLQALGTLVLFLCLVSAAVLRMFFPGAATTRRFCRRRAPLDGGSYAELPTVPWLGPRAERRFYTVIYALSSLARRANVDHRTERRPCRAAAWCRSNACGRPIGAFGEAGVVFVVGGIGGLDILNGFAHFVLPHCGVRHEVRDFDWQHGKGRFLEDLQDAQRITAKAHELADQVIQFKKHNPDQPVFLIGHSAGTGIVLEAAGQLPPCTIERIILLSAAVSPSYDLRPALQATRREIVSYHSAHDALILGVGTSQFGTVDRLYRPAAGMTGFQIPSDLSVEDQRLYDRLVQVPWKPENILESDAGAHHSTTTPLFLSRHVVPWLK